MPKKLTIKLSYLSALGFGLLVTSSNAWAMASLNQGGAKGGGQPNYAIPLLLTVAIAYMFILRPEQSRQKQIQQLVNNIEKGDEVTTKGGIIGKVTNVAEKILTLEIADKVRIKVNREFVHAVEKPKTE